jgi:hypothetical protein
MTADRDSKTGRFLPGNNANPTGRPSKRSLVEALRDMTDADALAAMLLKRAQKSDSVLMYVYDRLEGRPKQSSEVEVNGTVNAVLKWSDGSDA